MHEKSIGYSSQIYLETQAKEIEEKITRQEREKRIVEISEKLGHLSVSERMRLLLEANMSIIDIEDNPKSFSEDPFVLIAALEKFYKERSENLSTE